MKAMSPGTDSETPLSLTTNANTAGILQLELIILYRFEEATKVLKQTLGLQGVFVSCVLQQGC